MHIDYTAENKSRENISNVSFLSTRKKENSGRLDQKRKINETKRMNGHFSGPSRGDSAAETEGNR